MPAAGPARGYSHHTRTAHPQAALLSLRPASGPLGNLSASDYRVCPFSDRGLAGGIWSSDSRRVALLQKGTRAGGRRHWPPLDSP